MKGYFKHETEKQRHERMTQMSLLALRTRKWRFPAEAINSARKWRDVNRVKSLDYAKKASDAAKKIGPSNAQCWSLCSPMGVVHQFRDLKKFIESNKELFTEDQLIISPNGQRRIYSGLLHLSPRKKHPRSVSHGWTWSINHDKESRYFI